MALDHRIEIVREKYGLDKADFWELPQKKGTWLVKHSALEVAAARAGIVFDNPMIIEAASADGVAVISVRGELPAPPDKTRGQSEWSIGEASPKNNKNAYPWAMAEKRAKDRVILKLIGIHGLVYSEDEMTPEGPDADPPTQPKAKAREVDAEMRTEIDACDSIEQLQMLWNSKPFQAEYSRHPKDWQDALVEHFNERIADIRKSAKPVGMIDPRDQFNRMEREGAH